MDDEVKTNLAALVLEYILYLLWIWDGKRVSATMYYFNYVKYVLHIKVFELSVWSQISRHYFLPEWVYFLENGTSNSDPSREK